MRNAHRKCGSCGMIPEPGHSGPCPVDYEEMWIEVCHREDKCTASIDGCTRCDFSFQRRLFRDPVQLASALAAQWSEACGSLRTNPIQRWAADGFGDSALARQLKTISTDKKLDDAIGHLRLAVTLIALDSARVLIWNSDAISVDWLRAHANEAIAILDSSLPSWLRILRGETWLKTVQERWVEFKKRAEKIGSEVSEKKALHWVLSTHGEVFTAAQELKKEFFGSDHKALSILLKKESLTDAESILLLSVTATSLRTRRELWQEATSNCRNDLVQLTREIRRTPTDRRTLERSGVKLDGIWQSYLKQCAAMASSKVPLSPGDEVARLEGACRSELDARLAEHERQLRLREELLKLTASGHVREAEKLAGTLDSQFTDVELNPVYRVVAIFRRLRMATRLIAGVAATAVVVAIVLKVRVMSAKPVEIALASNVVIRLLPVPVGEFTLGSKETEQEAEQDERPATVARVVHRFWLGETEITQGQWKAVMRTGVLAQRGKHNQTNATLMLGDDLPMTFVSWEEAVLFCKEAEATSAGRNVKGHIRLPTEAEWEYACRAGTTTAFSFGPNATTTNGNFGPSAGSVAVKAFAPNPWGFFGMHGNVAEWVRGSPVVYPGGTVTEWSVPENNKDRLHRGGSWKMPTIQARSAARNWRPGGSAAEHVGFRVVWEPTN